MTTSEVQNVVRRKISVMIQNGLEQRENYSEDLLVS
jgi:hypothetical protein